MSSDSDSVESVQAKKPPTPNPFTASYFQDSQDPYQFMISNDITDFLFKQAQVLTIALTSELQEHQDSSPNTDTKTSSTEPSCSDEDNDSAYQIFMADRAKQIDSTGQAGPSTTQQGPQPTESRTQPHVEIPDDFDLDPPVKGEPHVS